jgi:hypothetical protein
MTNLPTMFTDLALKAVVTVALAADPAGHDMNRLKGLAHGRRLYLISISTARKTKPRTGGGSVRGSGTERIEIASGPKLY